MTEQLPDGFEEQTVDDPTFVSEEAAEWQRCEKCGSQVTHLGTRGKAKGLCPICREGV